MPSSSPAYFEHDPDFEEALLAVPTNVGRPAPAPLYTDAPYYAPTGFGEIGSFMRNKRAKLDVQFSARPIDESDLYFAKLAVYINGHTGDQGYAQLVNLLVLHGGKLVPFLDKKSLVTHIVASQLTPSKRLEFKAYKVVKPAWLVDSAAAGRLLDWRTYLESSGVYQADQAGSTLDHDRLGLQTNQRGLDFASVRSGKRKGSEVDEGETLADRGRRLATLAAIPSSSATLESPPPRQVVKTPSSDPPFAAYLPTATLGRNARACLADDAWLAEHTSRNPNYIAHYLANSRLHHISTWRLDLLLHYSDLQRSIVPPQRKSKVTGGAVDGRVIFHVDFDCYFVAAGLISRPQLRGKPVAVCHATVQGADSYSSTSEIASCSYEARAKGIKANMTLGRARELCPELLTMPFEFDLYRSTSDKFYKILLPYADFLTAVSVDEVLMEVSTRFPHASSSPSSSSDDRILAFANQIRAEILAATGCVASIGIGHNVLLAKLATKQAKPDGAYHLLPCDVDEHIRPLPVRDLPGIGGANADKLRAINVFTIGDLLTRPETELKAVLGAGLGVKFMEYAHGIDTRELQMGKARQSVGVDINYGIRFTTLPQVEVFMKSISAELAVRLQGLSVKTRHITLKLMVRDPAAPVDAPKFLGHGWCVTSSSSIAMFAQSSREKATDDGVLLGAAAWKLMLAALASGKDLVELRGIALTASKLEKDGRPVEEDVLERGQGRLSFLAAARTSDPSNVDDESETEDAIPLPPPRQQRLALGKGKGKVVDAMVECMTISSDDDDPPPRPRRCTRSATAPKPVVKVKKKDKVAPLFRQTAARSSLYTPALPPAWQLTDEDLELLEVDISYFRGLPRQDQQDLIDGVKRTHASLRWSNAKKVENQATLAQYGGRITKPSATPSMPKSIPVLVLASPTPSPILSPTTVTDLALAEFDFDPNTFRELPTQIQREELRTGVILKKKRRLLTVPAQHAQIRERDGLCPARIINLKVVGGAALANVSDTEALRDELERWIEQGRLEMPASERVDAWGHYFTDLLDERKGRDLKKLKDLLSWWEYLLVAEHGMEEHRSGTGEGWWRCYRELHNFVVLELRRDGGRTI